MSSEQDGRLESTRWIIHGERVVDDTRRLRLSIVQVELPDGVRFEQYVLRMPRAAMTVLLDNPGEHVLMIWRHRFVLDCWTWELPGGYVGPDEDPALTAAREVEEETGWRPRRMRPLARFQPTPGTADFENLLFLGEGAEDTGKPADIRNYQCRHAARAAARLRVPRPYGSLNRHTSCLHLLVQRAHPGSARNGVSRRDRSAR